MKSITVLCATLLTLPVIAFAGILPDTGQTNNIKDKEDKP
jgi:hypothetical protein